MKNKNKKKTSMKMGIIVAILLLAVGFAAVSTVLVINGTIKITPDQADFDKNVVFTDVSATPAQGVDGHQEDGTYATATTTDNNKTITFTTQVMKDIGETSLLKYKIKNDSQYAAKITSIECSQTAKPDDDHIKIEKDEFNNIVLQPKSESSEHKVTVTMVKSYVGDDKQISFTCTINATAEEATTE